MSVLVKPVPPRIVAKVRLDVDDAWPRLVAGRPGAQSWDVLPELTEGGGAAALDVAGGVAEHRLRGLLAGVERQARAGDQNVFELQGARGDLGPAGVRRRRISEAAWGVWVDRNLPPEPAGAASPAGEPDGHHSDHAPDSPAGTEPGWPEAAPVKSAAAPGATEALHVR
jgi:hypothetical protein